MTRAHVKAGAKGLLKKSAPVNAGEKRIFNVVIRQEVMMTNRKNVEQLRP